MSLSPLHLIRNFDSYMSGEVTIDPSAAIAPGVMLQADPNSQIIIAAGVCIGMGAVLHARDGILEIEAGATIGAGVLLVGRGKIGANACIGSATTILNCSIAPEQVVAPNSLLGDSSRTFAESAEPITTSPPMAEVTELSTQASPEPEQIQTQAEVNNNGSQVVYGKAALHQLMSTLFPHRQPLNQSLPESSSESQSTQESQ